MTDDLRSRWYEEEYPRGDRPREYIKYEHYERTH